MIHLFPDARTIIGIDNHPFLPPGDKRSSFKYSPIGVGSYSDVGFITGRGHVGPDLIGSLAAAVPGFRLRGVTVIEDREATLADPGSNRQRLAPRAVHAVVEFDAGPGTPTRQYVHINGGLRRGPGASYTANSWWWKMVDRATPSGVLLKGSMNGLRWERAGRHLAPTVLKWLRQSSGVLIEDRGMRGDKQQPTGALSDLARSPDGRWVPDHAGARSTAISLKDQFDFGYSEARQHRSEDNSVYVTVFDRTIASEPRASIDP